MTDYIPYARSLRAFASLYPDREALVVCGPGGRLAYSYAQYDVKVDAFAGALRGAGVGPGC
ncbi:MAG: fatty acid--CoA ligase, partial [Pseudomonadota bacterium]